MKGKKQYKNMLDDVCGEYCECDRYCILKEFLLGAHTSPRLLVQLKLIDKYKYEISEQQDGDIGWAEAMDLWVSSGAAKRFADVYEEGMTTAKIYKEVMKNEK